MALTKYCRINHWAGVISVHLPKRARDFSGQKFGKLTAIKPIEYNRHKQIVWHCQCDCGNTKDAVGSEIAKGNIRSCGCLGRHGHSSRKNRSPTYSSWLSMISRCTNPRDPQYHHYGGRGITVCERWRKFENFLADMGERPKGTSIDRIDGSGNYERSNCKWSTPKEQAQNRRNHRGEKTPSSKLTTEQIIAIKNDQRSSSDIAKDYSVNRRQISRIKSGERWAHIK